MTFHVSNVLDLYVKCFYTLFFLVFEALLYSGRIEQEVALNIFCRAVAVSTSEGESE